MNGTTGMGGSDFGKIAERIKDLAQLDMDAIEAYNEAIERIEAQDTRSKLSSFRDDHERHVRELTETLSEMGQQLPKRGPDVKGRLIEGMTAMRSAMGDDQALKAMKQNEEVTNHGYRDALEDEAWPSNLRTMIERNYSDEQHHLQWIEQQLSVTAGAGRHESY